MSSKRKVSVMFSDYVDSLPVDETTKRYLMFNEIDNLPEEFVRALGPDPEINRQIIDMYIEGNAVPTIDRVSLRKRLTAAQNHLVIPLDEEGEVKLVFVGQHGFLVAETFRDTSSHGTVDMTSDDGKTEGEEEFTQLDNPV